MPRVAVTGIGVISALGRTAEECGCGLRDGRSGIGPLQTVDVSSLRIRNGAEVQSYDYRLHFDEKTAGFLDRFAQFAVVAAREAAADADVDWVPQLREKAAVVTGSWFGGGCTTDSCFRDLYKMGLNRMPPLSIPKSMANAGTSYISMEFGITGPGLTVSTACASAANAIGQAFWMVRSGIVPLAITGGSEAPFAFGILRGWEAMSVVSPDTCRPFSKDRKGMVLGEGGAILVLEPLEVARARGVRIHAEIVGFGMSANTCHILQPSVDGAVRAMRAALRDAYVAPEAVGYINAHGTGMQANDAMEASAIRSVFGSHTERLAVSSTKSMHGHALGATGALEAIATVLALRDAFLPPTANFNEPDPACDLDVVPNVSRRAEFEYAMSNSFAFGGSNAVLAFRRA